MKSKFDIYKFLEGRPLSWSAKSSFDWDPEDWYQKYILGKKSPETADMRFGKTVGEKLASDPLYLPFVPRLDVFEHPFNIMYGKIKMTGFADSFCSVTNKKMYEYKTGVKKWDKKRVDNHGQIDMYLLMHYITTKIKPEDVECSLVWLPTKRAEGGDFDVKIEFTDDIERDFRVFKTKRTMADILRFASKVKKTVVLMEEYVNNHE